MVKSYLRYAERAAFGVIASPDGNAVFLGRGGRLVVAPALERCVVWDAKTAARVAEWADADVRRAHVTFIAVAQRGDVAAVGYSDGAVRLWDTASHSLKVVLNGHRAAVTALAFDASGGRLASGARDTDVIVWDTVAETGVVRLRGHKNLVSGLAFVPHRSQDGAEPRPEDFLISASTDSLLKLWDLRTQHCVETAVAHRSELWAMAYNPATGFLYTAAADPELKVWRVDLDLVAAEAPAAQPAGEDGESAAARPSPFVPLGSIARRSKERAAMLRLDPTGTVLGVQAADKTVEFIRLLDLDEVKKRLARKRRRQREKEKAGKGKPAAPDADDDMPDPGAGDPELNAGTHFRPAHVLTLPAKVRSFDFALPKQPVRGSEPSLLLAATLSNNTIELYNIRTEQGAEEPSSLAYSITLPGHRSDLRALALSSDAALLLSGSSDGAKVWNLATGAAIRTLASGYVTCCAFVPGDKHVVLGTKEGALELWELPGSSMLESHEAHEGTLWAMQVRPDRRGLATGGQDKAVKFWDFGFVESNGTKKLTLNHVRTLLLSDPVLALCHSPSQSFLAVSLLDSTVKIFRHDTLKFHLSLYGHKLPVLSLDISSDNALIATGGSDKTVKIWGMDFGDCHRSLIAHEGGVTALKWVWGTHYLWTVGRDGMAKYWDMDAKEMVQQIPAHRSEAWCLAVAPHGRFVATGSHDRSVRVLERTDVQLFLEEEREREMEEAEEAELAKEPRNEGAIGSGVPDELGNLPEREDGPDRAGRKTAEALKAGEEIMEALDVWEDDKGKEEEARRTGGVRSRNPYIAESRDPEMEAEKYVLGVVEGIRSAELEDALLVLPFARVTMLLAVLCVWVERGWNVPLTSRILLILLRTHHNQLVATRLLRPTLGKIQRWMRQNLEKQKSMLGFNLAALKFIKGDWIAAHSGISDLVDGEQPEPEKEAPVGKAGKRNKRKRVVIKS
ncbi:WD40-repeat-containing domain protein [Hyaloraphidium curvatum]|nr:WD40-repeat-containing domain protein [Hyaloraphidium curvatum]